MTLFEITLQVVELLEVPQVFYPQYTDNYVVLHGPQGPGILCTSFLDMAAANVICKSTKQLFAVQVRSGSVPRSHFGGQRYTAVLDCTGDEDSLSQCKTVRPVGVSSCILARFDAIVDCTTSKQPSLCSFACPPPE